MLAIGMSLDGATDVATALGAVLHLGQLAFEELASAGGDDGSRVATAATARGARSAASLAALGRLLLVPTEAVQAACCVKTMAAFGVEMPLSPRRAAATRDALTRALYASLFEHVLQQALHPTSAPALPPPCSPLSQLPCSCPVAALRSLRPRLHAHPRLHPPPPTPTSTPPSPSPGQHLARTARRRRLGLAGGRGRRRRRRGGGGGQHRAARCIRLRGQLAP